MRKHLVTVCVVAVVTLFISLSSAHAQTQISLVGYGPGGPGNFPVINLTLTGTLDGSSTGNPGGSLPAPVYDITAATGTIGGFNATLDPTTPVPGALTNDGAFEWDNQLSLNTNGTLVDNWGLLFILDGGIGESNIYSNGTSGAPFSYYNYSQSPNLTTPLTLSATVTPEPASMLLFGTGLLGIAWTMRKQLFA
jgi:hypothetical protein